MFDASVIRLWLDLPPVQAGTVSDGPTLAATIDRMTPDQYRAFEQSLALDQHLYDKWSQLRADFAGLAHPGKEGWPDPDSADLLEEHFVGVAPVACLVYCTDGRRYVRELAKSSRLLTWAEFAFFYGHSVGDYLKIHLRERIARFERALALVEIDDPHIVNASFVKGEQVFSKNLRVYHDSQVSLYARHQRLTLLGTE